MKRSGSYDILYLKKGFNLFNLIEDKEYHYFTLDKDAVVRIPRDVKFKDGDKLPRNIKGILKRAKKEYGKQMGEKARAVEIQDESLKEAQASINETKEVSEVFSKEVQKPIEVLESVKKMLVNINKQPNNEIDLYQIVKLFCSVGSLKTRWINYEKGVGGYTDEGREIHSVIDKIWEIISPKILLNNPYITENSTITQFLKHIYFRALEETSTYADEYVAKLADLCFRTKQCSDGNGNSYYFDIYDGRDAFTELESLREEYLNTRKGDPTMYNISEGMFEEVKTAFEQHKVIDTEVSFFANSTNENKHNK